MEALVFAGVLAGYVVVGLVTARYFYRRQYREWMDRQIRHAQPVHPGVCQERPERLRERLRETWERQESVEALKLALVQGVFWVASWPLVWMSRDPQPSPQERLLMDRAAYRRLRELERRVGLRPLDDLGLAEDESGR